MDTPADALADQTEGRLRSKTLGSFLYLGRPASDGFDVPRSATRNVPRSAARTACRLEHWGFLDLGCGGLQDWPDGYEVVVDDGFLGPTVVVGDFVEEVGELSGAVGDGS